MTNIADHVASKRLALEALPAIPVRPVDRPAYIASLEAVQSGAPAEAFNALMFARLDETLDNYINAAGQALDYRMQFAGSGRGA